MIAARPKKSLDRPDIRVASVLARATALSDELRSTIKELVAIIRRGEDEQKSA